jgi:hypothetical protein
LGKPLSLAAKIGIGLGAAVFAMFTLAVGLYAAMQRKRAQKAEGLNKLFGMPGHELMYAYIYEVDVRSH